MVNNHFQHLPLTLDIESRTILKKWAKTHQALAELKGVASSILNQSILTNNDILEIQSSIEK